MQKRKTSKGLRKAASKCGCQTTCVWPTTTTTTKSETTTTTYRKQQNQQQYRGKTTSTSMFVDGRNALLWRPLDYRQTDGKWIGKQACTKK